MKRKSKDISVIETCKTIAIPGYGVFLFSNFTYKANDIWWRICYRSLTMEDFIVLHVGRSEKAAWNFLEHFTHGWDPKAYEKKASLGRSEIVRRLSEAKK